MTGKTHIIGGVATGILYSMNMGYDIRKTVITVGVTTLGSLLPDIDKTTSKIGRKLPILSFIVSKIFGHRGLFHYHLFYILLGFVGVKFFNEYSFYIYQLLIGIFSHLLLDLLNPMGIPLITPKGKKFNLLSIYTGSIGENIVAILIIIITTLYAAKTINII